MSESFDWFVPPQPQAADHPFSRAEIVAALDALVTFNSLDEFHALLLQWQHVLCSEQSLITLCLTSMNEWEKGEME